MIPKSKISSIVPKVPIPHRDWNAAFNELRQNRPLIVSAEEGGGWKHPWKPSFNYSDDGWTVRIKPGFVNARKAREVEVTIPLSSAPQATKDREAAGDAELVGDDRVRAYLTESPDIPLSNFRKIGPDAEEGDAESSDGLTGEINFETVPEFFQAMGVGDPPSVEWSIFSGFELSPSTSDPSQRRLLRACDVVLRQERLGTATDWSFGGGLVDGTVAQFDLIYTNTNYRRNAYIYLTPKFTQVTSEDVSDPLRGNWQDNPYDELKVATLYFVSPPGAASGSDVDVSWSPFAKNYLFWNLNHETNLIPTQQTNSNNITFPIPGLALGSAGLIFDLFLAVNNDAYDAALEFLSGRRLGGRFWTT